MATLQSDQDGRLLPLLPRRASWLPPPDRFVRLRSMVGLLSATSEANYAQARWWKLVPIDLLKFGGLMLVIPTLTNVKTAFFHGDTAKAALVQSVMESSRAVFAILVSAQLGQLSDFVGRRPLITLSVLCTMVPLVCLTMFPTNLYYYFVAYTLAGLLGGQSSSASQAYLADCSSQQDRARIFGLQGAVMSALIMVLPGVSTFIEYHYGMRVLYTIAVGIEVIAVIATFMIPESLPKQNRQRFVASFGFSKVAHTLQELFLRRGSLLWDLAMLRFFKGMITGGPVFFAMKSIFDLTDADFSILMFVSGLCGIIVQSVVIKLMVRCGFSQLTMIIFSFAVDACYYAACSCLGFFPVKFLLYFWHGFDTLSTVYMPAFTSLITQGVDDDKGFVLGSFQTIDNITGFLSPLLLGFVYQISPVAPFVVAAVANVLCILFARMIRARMPENVDDQESPKDTEKRLPLVSPTTASTTDTSEEQSVCSTPASMSESPKRSKEAVAFEPS